MEYVTIDFETGNPKRHSMCEVGIVTVKDGIIVDEYSSLIRPPDNHIIPQFTQIHGILPQETMYLEEFPWYFENEIKRRLEGKLIVAHNQAFDRSVLMRTMEHFEYDYFNDLNIQNHHKWECTMNLFKFKHKFLSGALKYLCDDLNIPLNHHKALDDARACAHLYFKHMMNDYKILLKT